VSNIVPVERIHRDLLYILPALLVYLEAITNEAESNPIIVEAQNWNSPIVIVFLLFLYVEDKFAYKFSKKN
jgi:hypothetical protein